VERTHSEHSGDSNTEEMPPSSYAIIHDTDTPYEDGIAINKIPNNSSDILKPSILKFTPEKKEIPKVIQRRLKLWKNQTNIVYKEMHRYGSLSGQTMCKKLHRNFFKKKMEKGKKLQ
jgi:hypothetical protein